MCGAYQRATKDDIVTRLRENCDTSDCVNIRSIALVKCDNCDAADEIERLRLILTHICDVWGSDLLSIIEEMKQFKKDIK